MKIAGMRTTSEAAPPAVRYKIGLVQMAMSADPDANLNTAVAKVAEAAAAGARLVCLPELFRSRYFAQHEVERRGVLVLRELARAKQHRRAAGLSAGAVSLALLRATRGRRVVRPRRARPRAEHGGSGAGGAARRRGRHRPRVRAARAGAVSQQRGRDRRRWPPR